MTDPELILPSAKVPDVIFEAAKFGIRASAKEPDVILEVDKFGIRPSAKEPDVILDAGKFGISAASNDILALGTVPEVRLLALRLDKSTCCVTFDAANLASANVPLVIFDAARSGILSTANVPDVILEVGKLGISFVPKDNRPEGIVPEVKLEAFRFDRSAVACRA